MAWTERSLLGAAALTHEVPMNDFHASSPRSSHHARARLAGQWLAVTMLVLAAVQMGCESEDPAEIRSYTDSAGRSCTVDIHDISHTATCDADPAALADCAEGTEAAFTVSDDYDFETEIWTVESCAGCVNRAEMETYIVSESCAPVTCETDDDCVFQNPRCMGGICQHM